MKLQLIQFGAFVTAISGFTPLSKGIISNCRINQNYFISRTLNAEPEINKSTRKPAGEDIISRLFGAFLPTPESIGLSRFSAETLPENFPATKVVLITSALSKTLKHLIDIFSV
jgi:hypothetical protein